MMPSPMPPVALRVVSRPLFPSPCCLVRFMRKEPGQLELHLRQWCHRMNDQYSTDTGRTIFTATLALLPLRRVPSLRFRVVSDMMSQ